MILFKNTFNTKHFANLFLPTLQKKFLILLFKNTMNSIMKKTILNDSLIKKFSLYGFLKNLKFFEPFLLIFLLNKGLTLLQIGFLISIREIILNVFEIPSGFIADYIGKKKELYICFTFYIISFIFFFFTTNFFIASLAMFFFGLGEAFRTGSHKALIYSYLDQKGWSNYKTFVYGHTRSASLLGSSLSSILGIIFILTVPDTNYIFLISIVPYMIDFLLIISYPNSIDSKTKNVNFINFIKTSLKNIFTNINLNKLIINNGLFEGIISSIKDYIQPILQVILISSTAFTFFKFSNDETLKIILGLTYCAIYIVSSFGSRNSYRLMKFYNCDKWLKLLYLALPLLILILAFTVEIPFFVILIFISLYLLTNIRKPIFISVIDNNMNKQERTTVLSLTSQFKSLFTILLAPVIGFIADRFGLNYSLFFLVLVLLISYPLVLKK